MDNNCCIKCFEEAEIKRFIKNIGTISDCAYCGRKHVYCAPINIVGEYIRDGIERAYESVDEGTGSMRDSETKSYSDEGEPIKSILQWDLSVFSDELSPEQSDTLCNVLLSESGPSIRDIQHGDDDWMCNNNLVLRDALYGYESIPQHEYWEAFKYSCKHFNRFFDLGGPESSRAQILSSLDGIFSSMEIELPAGMSLYRARIYEMTTGKSLMNIDMLKEISPPPSHKAQNSRMSPSGISYTYLAADIDTCLAEIHAQDHDSVLVGEFKLISNLKILDMTCVPNLIMTSCFSQEYDHSQNWVGDFIEHFIDEISAPISNDAKDLEYVATQLLAEYIRMKGFCGIKYVSSLRSGGINYVMFCGPDTESDPIVNEYQNRDLFRILPISKWMNLINVQHLTCSIKHTIIEQAAYVREIADEHYRDKLGALRFKDNPDLLF